MPEKPDHELPEFGLRIRQFRRSLDLRQHQFAALLKVPETTVARWEHGRSMPRFANLRAMYELGQENQIYAQIFPILDFESVFFLSDVWKEEAREGSHRHFLRVTVTNRTGITAQVLTVIAEHEGNLLRVAGFECAEEGSTHSIVRILVDLPPHRDREALDEAIRALDDVLLTEYPLRPPANGAAAGEELWIG
jgi:transcriptional regulator with XRE-family HTH domain